MPTMTPPRTDTHLALAERVRAYIDLHADEPLPLARLAREAGVSPAHLQRTFTRVVGLSPKQYQEQRRVGALKTALRAGQTVSSATFEAGYGTGRRVYETADDALGMTPGAYRRRGVGVTIHYTIVPVSLGLLLVAVTERGVCAVSLGDDENALVASLRDELPAAEIVRATPTASSLGGGPPSRDARGPTRCRATCARPRSSGRCGAPCSAFPRAPRARIRRSRGSSASRRRRVPWRARARAIASPC
jgi:AraC-like DNA-binding protein